MGDDERIERMAEQMIAYVSFTGRRRETLSSHPDVFVNCLSIQSDVRSTLA